MKRGVLATGTALLAWMVAAAPAWAQTTEPSGAEEPLLPSSVETEEGEEDEAIVVTGTRLPSEFTGSAPVQVLTIDEATVAGIATAADIVSRSTAAAGSQQINNRLSATGPGGQVNVGGANANTIGLRNLNATRTLTLVNGRRLTPSGTGSQVGPVDLNVLPSVIIDRVEVLTTGASSVYGSDAIAGVVNIITRSGGNGLEVSGFTRLPEAGGGENAQASLYWGRTFDRGHINFAAEIDRQWELDLEDRPQTACAQDFVFDPDTGERIDLRDQFGNFKCRNHNPNGIFFDELFYGGSFILDPTLAGGPYPPAALTLRGVLPDWVRANRAGFPDTYTYAPSSSSAYDKADSISPLRRINLYASGAHDLGDNAEGYFELLYHNRDSRSNSWYFLFPRLSATNPNNTVADALIAASGGGSNGVVYPQVVRPFRADQNIDYFQATLGLRGNFGRGRLSGWRWDISARFGLSEGTYGQTFYYADRLRAATAPGVDCDPSLITVSGPATCLSIPWLTQRFLVDQNWTDAERDFLEGYETGRTEYEQFAIDGVVSGELFSLPAGDVAVALGFAYRQDTLDDTPGPNAQARNYFAFSTAGRTAGSDTVKELFAEVGVPILADSPIARQLNVTISGRYTDYESYGSDGTYKISGLWQIFDALGVRASYGTSFRAPALYELYLADQTSFFNYFDPCVRYGEGSNPTVAANCAAEGFAPDYAPATTSILGIAGGGIGLLEAETSRNINAGIVITPPFADLRLAVDYYDIEVRNEVSSYGVAAIINGCYARETGRESFCSRITRDPVTGVITTVNNRFLNLAEQRNRGIDVALQMGFDLSFARLSIDVRGSRTLENSLRRDEFSFEERNGFSGFPKLTGYAEARLAFDRFIWFLGADYIGPVDDAGFYENGNRFNFFGAYSGRNNYGNNNDPTPVEELLSVPSYVTVYTSLRWNITDEMMVQAGVSNLLDKAPPVIGPDAFTYRTGSVPGNLYNLTGRTFFLRLRQRF